MRWPWNKESEGGVATMESTEKVKQGAAIPSLMKAMSPSLSDEEMDEYIQTATRIGIDSCGDLTREKIRRCLRDEQIDTSTKSSSANNGKNRMGVSKTKKECLQVLVYSTPDTIKTGKFAFLKKAENKKTSHNQRLLYILIISTFLLLMQNYHV